MYHIDPDVEKAMVALADALCAHERNTERKSTLIFVPHQPDEKMILLDSGKPVAGSTQTDILLAFSDAQITHPCGCPIQAILLEAVSACAQVESDIPRLGIV